MGRAFFRPGGPCKLAGARLLQGSSGAKKRRHQDDKSWSGIISMHRPKGVIAIAALFAVAAIYLSAIAAILLISPGTISLMAGKCFAYGLEIAGPYMILLVGSCYAVIAWGLFRLQNWARWLAMLVIAFSIVPLLPKIST